MNKASRMIFTALAGTGLLLAGCTKKPTRPEPSATMLGPAGGTNGALNPLDVATTADANSGLEPRGSEAFDQQGQLRGVLDSVFFDFDKSAIKPGERAKAQAAAKYLSDHPERRMLLEGHCDWRGTAEYNLGLGDRRASAVKQYLLTLGVAANRLDTLSRGSLDATPHGDEATMAHDRRVDFVILK